MKSFKKEVKILNFIVPVWGKEYTSLWINYALASLLSDNNLKVIDTQYIKMVFLMCTDKKTKSTLNTDQSMNILNNYASIVYIECGDIINEFSYKGKELDANYLKMTAMQNRAISYGIKHNSNNFCFIMADNIFFDGSINNLISIIKNKNPASIQTYGLHIEYEGISSKLDYCKEKDKSLKISSKKLSKLAIEHTHIASKSKYVDSPKYLPSAMVIFNNNFEVVIHMCILHPIYVYVEELIDEYDTFDRGGFLAKQRFNDSIIIESSSVFVLHSLDKRDNKSFYNQIKYCKANPLIIAERISKIEPYLQKNFLKGFLLESGDKKLEKDYIKERAYKYAKTSYSIFLDMKHMGIEFPIKKILFANEQKELINECIILNNFIKKLILKENNEIFSFNKESISLKLLKISKISKIKSSFIIKKFILEEVYKDIFEEISNYNGLWAKSSRLYYAYKRYCNFIKNNNGKIVLYGAGNDTMTLLSLERNKKIMFVVDDYMKKDFYLNIPIKSSKDLEQLNEEDMVLICSSNHGEKIYKKIKQNKNIRAKIKKIFTPALISDNTYTNSIYFKRFNQKINKLTRTVDV